MLHQLASDRTSCQSPLANQFRLVLHTAAYWLMLALRDAVPAGCRSPGPSSPPSLLKIGARVVEKAARIRICFGLSRRRPVPPAGRAPRRMTLTAGAPCPANPRPFNPQPRRKPRRTQKAPNGCPCALEISR